MFILLLGALRCLFLMLKLNAFKVDQCTLFQLLFCFIKMHRQIARSFCKPHISCKTAFILSSLQNCKITMIKNWKKDL